MGMSLTVYIGPYVKSKKGLSEFLEEFGWCRAFDEGGDGPQGEYYIPNIRKLSESLGSIHIDKHDSGCVEVFDMNRFKPKNVNLQPFIDGGDPNPEVYVGMLKYWS